MKVLTYIHYSCFHLTVRISVFCSQPTHWHVRCNQCVTPNKVLPDLDFALVSRPNSMGIPAYLDEANKCSHASKKVHLVVRRARRSQLLVQPREVVPHLGRA